ncbi:hypothetical protein FE257_012333 [Aspergillus nanangensis]|uniref:SnoaL-like domain-containing protein n=1 Tax=Aspergillus nanangensis TaxID=2582783 RepID=A0AAD4CG25_ASPNN|nr:hypothetical protein FE257_012333 [Aspergillus nanangensis]
MTPAVDKYMQESEIKSLLVRERYYRDTCQWDKLRACYHPDASKTHIEITWFQGDIDGFVAGSRGMVIGGTGAVHTISPVELHVNGDKALSESSGAISIRFYHDGVEYDVVSFTRFISRLECVDGEWKLLTLDVIYDRDYIMPTVPSSKPVDLPLFKGGRESYKCVAWVLSQKGFSVKQDLPGVDDPLACTRLMEDQFKWLY